MIQLIEERNLSSRIRKCIIDYERNKCRRRRNRRGCKRINQLSFQFKNNKEVYKKNVKRPKITQLEEMNLSSRIMKRIDYERNKCKKRSNERQCRRKKELITILVFSY